MSNQKTARAQSAADVSRDELVAEVAERYDMAGVAVRRRRSPQPGEFAALPEMGQLWQDTRTGDQLVVLDNAQRPKKGRWCAVWETGEMRWPADDDLEPCETVPRLTLEEVARRCRDWARTGCPDAMNWLGHYHEFGTEDTEPDGLQALAYYMAAIRRDPENFAHNFERVWHDSINLFQDHKGPREIRQGAEARSRFIEFTAAGRTHDGRITLGYWREAIEIAEDSG